MPDIYHHFLIKSPAKEVFQAVTSPEGLDAWWTLSSSGKPIEGTEYQLGFGSGYDWQAVVTRSVKNREFELQLTSADDDWQDTRVGFLLDEQKGVTHVRFHHQGWKEANDHFCTSTFCWAMYLRLLKRYVEKGEVVAYADRLDT